MTHETFPSLPEQPDEAPPAPLPELEPELDQWGTDGGPIPSVEE